MVGGRWSKKAPPSSMLMGGGPSLVLGSGLERWSGEVVGRGGLERWSEHLLLSVFALRDHLSGPPRWTTSPDLQKKI